MSPQTHNAEGHLRLPLPYPFPPYTAMPRVRSPIYIRAVVVHIAGGGTGGLVANCILQILCSGTLLTAHGGREGTQWRMHRQKFRNSGTGDYKSQVDNGAKVLVYCVLPVPPSTSNAITRRARRLRRSSGHRWKAESEGFPTVPG